MRLGTLTLVFAACLTSGCASPEQTAGVLTADEARMNALRIENEQLRTQVSIATRQRMARISQLAQSFADEHKRWPSKPSDLKPVSMNDWSLFIAPYDTSDQLLVSLQGRADVWDWIDANGSYTFFNVPYGTTGTEKVVFQERRDFIPGLRWQCFDDGHLELTKPRRVVAGSPSPHEPAG